MDQEKIAKFICDLRKSKKLTQSEFAEKLNVTAQAVSKWENARGIPDIETIKKISEIFNVDIDSILNGKKKKSRKILVYIAILLIFVFIGIYFSFNRQNYSFTDIKSTDNDWKVKGVAAYSSSKNSIYISDIKTLNKKINNEKYTVVECVLYENNKDIDKKISQCGKIDNNKNYDKTKVKKISELLKDIEFKVDNYKTTCNNLNKSNLYIDINLLTTDKKIVTYKVPLKLNSNCK